MCFIQWSGDHQQYQGGDIRTFHLLRTVPQLGQCQVVFNYGGEVIFANSVKVLEINSENRFLTAFKIFDSSDYSLIATIDTKNNVVGLCSSWDDCYLAEDQKKKFIDFCGHSYLPQ